MSSEEDGSFSITFKWDAQLMQIQAEYFNLPETEEVDGSTGTIFTIAFAIIVVLTAALWLMESEGWVPQNGAVMFLAGAAVSGVIAIWAVSKLINQMFDKAQTWEQEAIDDTLSKPATTLAFGPTGFSETTADSHHTFKWSAVKEVREFAFGIVLVLAPKHGVFVDDHALPDGIDRAEALIRIRKWKGPW